MNKEKGEKIAEISARISKVIDFLQETPNSFSVKLGYNRAQTIYDIRDMKSAPSYDFFYRFCVAGYSAIINIEWILTGEEPMLKQKVDMHDSTLTSPQSEKADIYYNMYKEQQNEVRLLTEEIGALKERLRQYERQIESFQDLPSIRSDVAKQKKLKKKTIIVMGTNEELSTNESKDQNLDHSVAGSVTAGYITKGRGNNKSV